MKNRGQKYREQIKQLKKLRHRIDRTAYYKLMQNMCSEFAVSDKTIYRDMNKRLPGIRKHRNDIGRVRSSRVTKTEIKVVEEIMSNANRLKKAKDKIKELTGKNICQPRLNRVRKAIEKKIKDKSGKTNDVQISMFGKNAKQMLEQMFELDLIGDEHFVKLKSPHGSIFLDKNDLKDIIMILANSFNRNQFADSKKLNLDRDELRKIRMMHLVEEQMNVARDNLDYKLVESLTRMLERVQTDIKLPDDFDTMLKVAKELKADIASSELIELIKRISK